MVPNETMPSRRAGKSENKCGLYLTKMTSVTLPVAETPKCPKLEKQLPEGKPASIFSSFFSETDTV